ncbi:MAG: hypothetical protein PHW03_07220 [Eubacteriales bacterium]|nr:hypothetical protein [Eubacteriales bacterium]
MQDFIVRYWLQVLFGAAATGAAFAWKWIRRRSNVEKGLRALLRDRIIFTYNHYEEKGYCPIYAKENATSMYDEYHALGGNGTITKIYEELMNLPTKDGDDDD